MIYSLCTTVVLLENIQYSIIRLLVKMLSSMTLQNVKILEQLATIDCNIYFLSVIPTGNSSTVRVIN